MPSVLTIARKEFVDHVSDQTFLACFGILLVVMAGTAFYQVQMYSTIVPQREVWLDIPMYLYHYLTTQLSSLGAILAITLSITSVSKERAEGSLKVLFSYPISRGKIILGKLLAGVSIVSLVTVATLSISFSIMTYYLSIPLTLDFVSRIAAVTAFSILLLTFFLCLGTAVSTPVKSASTSLLILLVALFLMSGNTLFMLTVLGGMLFPGIILSGGYAYEVSSYPWTTGTTDYFRRYAWASPVEAFNHFARGMFTFVPGWGSETMLTFDVQLSRNQDLFAAPLVITLVAFVACYVLFVRSEVS